jgi:hypothetical protein
MRLGRSRRGHTPALTGPSHTRAAGSQAASDPDLGRSGVAKVVLRDERIFFSRKLIFPSKNPSKSIFTPKIVKPFPESF